MKGTQVPENLKLVARQWLSQLHGLPLSALNVGNSAKTQYPLQGKTAFQFKVRNNESGAVYQISLDSSGQEVNTEQLLEQERLAYEAKYGKLSPSLVVKLASASPEQPLKVILWLNTPPYTGPQRPDPDTSISLAQQKAFRAQVNAQRAAFVKPIVDGVATKLRNLGFQVISTDQYTSIVTASLTPSAIRQVARWGEVKKVYENGRVQPYGNSASNMEMIMRLGSNQ